MKNNFRHTDNAFNSRHIHIDNQGVMKKANVKDVYASSPHTMLDKGVSNLAGIRTDNAQRYNVKRGTGSSRVDIDSSRLKYLSGGRSESDLLENKITQRTKNKQKQDNYNIGADFDLFGETDKRGKTNRHSAQRGHNDSFDFTNGLSPEKQYYDFSSLASSFADKAKNDGSLAGQRAGQAIDMGITGIQTAAPVIPTAFKQVGKGAFHAGDFTFRVIKTAVLAGDGIKTGKIQLNKDTLVHLKDISSKTGLLKTHIVRSISGAAKRIKTTVNQTKTAIDKTKTTAIKAFNVARGALSGKTRINISKNTLEYAGAKFKSGAAIASRVSVKAVKTTGNAAIKTGSKIGSAAGKPVSDSLSYAADKAADYAAQSDNMALNGIGKSVKTIKTTKKTINTIKHANSGLQTGQKTIFNAAKKTLQTGKNITRRISFIKNHGLKRAFNARRAKMSKSIANGVKNVSQSVAKAIGKVVLSKTGVVIAAAVIILGIIPALAGAPIAAIFSHRFTTKNDDGTYTDWDVAEFLNQPEQVPKYMDDEISAIIAEYKSNLVENGGEIHQIRFGGLKTDQESELERAMGDLGGRALSDITITSNGDATDAATKLRQEFSSVSVSEIIDLIFNVLLLKDYELEPTQEQASELAKEIVHVLFDEAKKNATAKRTREACSNSVNSLEWSTMDELFQIINDAAVSNPNYDTGDNPDYDMRTDPNIFFGIFYGYDFILAGGNYYDTMDDFLKGILLTEEDRESDEDKFACPFCGIIHAGGNCLNMSPDKDEEPFYHGDYTCPKCDSHIYDDEGNITGHECSGYRVCGGHNILTITLKLEGVYVLVQKYFQEPIDALANKASRTPEEERLLQDLKSYLEILEELLKLNMGGLGGSLGVVDLEKVDFLTTSREGNYAIIQTALSQTGNIGGETFWRWYGFSSRVEWCSCFASWCFNQNGYTSPKFSACQEGGVKWCKDNGKWQEPDYTELAPGDLIFFDWDGIGKAQHVGLVVGIDADGYVYTVEGNAGDAVKIKKYELTNPYIMGFGLIG